MDDALPHYDLIVIGSGSGNSLLDERFENLKIALVDRGIEGKFGGTCLNVGCIPTKMFVHPADLATAHLEAARLGVTMQRGHVDFEAVRDRIFGRIDLISESGRDWRERNPHITVIDGHARFTGPRQLGVAGGKITADRVVIAAGSRPRPLDVPGADDVVVHTSDTVMRLPELPKTMIILGGGFVAAEMAYIFSAYGTKVTLINRSSHLLRREDEDVSERFTELVGRRIPVRLDQTLVRLEDDEETGEVVVVTEDAEGVEYEYSAEVVLNATGRIPNGDEMNLQAAGIEVDEAGYIVVDDQQRTTAEGVFAMGDVSSPWQLKHVANHETRVVQHNLLNPDAMIAANHYAVPHAVFSHPQISAVGATEQELRAAKIPYVRAVQDFGSVAYGWALEDTDHFCKVLASPDGTLLGAHIIGPEASMLIQPLVQAMALGTPVKDVARGQYWIHPALTEVVENALLALPLEGDARPI
ncbi:mycothione reductase [Mariniluteicoccus endophyticus]